MKNDTIMIVHQFRVVAATADEAAMKAADKYPGYEVKVWRSPVPMIGGKPWWEVKVISGRDGNER